MVQGKLNCGEIQTIKVPAESGIVYDKAPATSAVLTPEIKDTLYRGVVSVVSKAAYSALSCLPPC
jgi:hypothetical protein